MIFFVRFYIFNGVTRVDEEPINFCRMKNPRICGIQVSRIHEFKKFQFSIEGSCKFVEYSAPANSRVPGAFLAKKGKIRSEVHMWNLYFKMFTCRDLNIARFVREKISIKKPLVAILQLIMNLNMLGRTIGEINMKGTPWDNYYRQFLLVASSALEAKLELNYD